MEKSARRRCRCVCAVAGQSSVLLHTFASCAKWMSLGLGAGQGQACERACVRAIYSGVYADGVTLTACLAGTHRWKDRSIKMEMGKDQDRSDFPSAGRVGAFPLPAWLPACPFSAFVGSGGNAGSRRCLTMRC